MERFHILRIYHGGLLTRVLQYDRLAVQWVTYYVTNGVVNFQAPLPFHRDDLHFHISNYGEGVHIIAGWGN